MFWFLGKGLALNVEHAMKVNHLLTFWGRPMSRILCLMAFPFLMAAPVAASTATHAPVFAETEMAHGGGCRKSSPPGKCCHMQTSTGQVHCH